MQRFVGFFSLLCFSGADYVTKESQTWAVLHSNRSRDGNAIDQQEAAADPSKASFTSSTGHVAVLSQVGAVEG